MLQLVATTVLTIGRLPVTWWACWADITMMSRPYLNEILPHWTSSCGHCPKWRGRTVTVNSGVLMNILTHCLPVVTDPNCLWRGRGGGRPGEALSVSQWNSYWTSSKLLPSQIWWQEAGSCMAEEAASLISIIKGRSVHWSTLPYEWHTDYLHERAPVSHSTSFHLQHYSQIVGSKPFELSHTCQPHHQETKITRVTTAALYTIHLKVRVDSSRGLTWNEPELFTAQYKMLHMILHMCYSLLFNLLARAFTSLHSNSSN